MTKEEIFFRLVRIALGNETGLPGKLTEEEWNCMANLSRKQALGGIIMQAIEKLPPEYRPPQKILFQWIGWTGKIENVNRRLNREAVAVSLYLENKGFRSMILKGQGVAELYPNPLRRTPGDIDIWLDGTRKSIFRLARSVDPEATAVYHHIDMKRLSEEFEVRVPSMEMNRIFLLVHIYRHLMTEGIGLKQLMDYFYLLKQGMTSAEREKFTEQVRELKMKRFAEAVMYVLNRVFGLEERMMPVPPSEKYGKRLLDEIMLAGNFGQYDTRIERKGMDSEWGRFRERMKRIMRFVRDYPDEVCWTPYFKIWHFFWRKIHNSKI